MKAWVQIDLRNYLAHALCVGAMEFDFNGNHFTMQKGDLIIVRKGKLIENVTVSDDFKVRVVYIDSGFVEHCTPHNPTTV